MTTNGSLREHHEVVVEDIEYGRVDDRLMWQIAIDFLPPLKSVVENILASLPPDPVD